MVEEETRVTDGKSDIRISKVSTPKGERLEIASPELGTRIRLDALDLESITWQDTTAFEEVANDQGTDRELPPFLPEEAEAVHFVDVVNEFAHVEIYVLETPRAEGLMIRSVDLGYRIRLRPTHLELLSCCETEVTSGFLTNPLGPEPRGR